MTPDLCWIYVQGSLHVILCTFVREKAEKANAIPFGGVNLQKLRPLSW